MENKPEIKFRAGPLSATVWQNQGQSKYTGESAVYKTISIERAYKDKKDGTWKYTNSFRINDLPKAALVLTKAYEHLVLKGQDTLDEEAII